MSEPGWLRQRQKPAPKWHTRKGQSQMSCMGARSTGIEEFPFTFLVLNNLWMHIGPFQHFSARLIVSCECHNKLITIKRPFHYFACASPRIWSETMATSPPYMVYTYTHIPVTGASLSIKGVIFLSSLCELFIHYCWWTDITHWCRSHHGHHPKTRPRAPRLTKQTQHYVTSAMVKQEKYNKDQHLSNLPIRFTE